jgi:hypothetical protein
MLQNVFQEPVKHFLPWIIIEISAKLNSKGDLFSVSLSSSQSPFLVFDVAERLFKLVPTLHHSCL